VPDSTINAIDRFFDCLDSGVEKIDHVINRAKYTEEQHLTRRARGVEIVASPPKQKPAKKMPALGAAPTAATAALSRKPRFYIVESFTPSGTMFVVTDGGTARAECSTRELALKLLRALEKT
jgi:hypothetical protein